MDINTMMLIIRDDNSDDESAVQQETQNQTIAMGWEGDEPSTSTAQIHFDYSPPEDEDDVPLGYDPAYEPDPNILYKITGPPCLLLVGEESHEHDDIKQLQVPSCIELLLLGVVSFLLHTIEYTPIYREL
ncbi:hypothetical protein LOK49_LG13G00720 [Camellia lanceoleosa]|uniref:Uncharacterized protein n=1 Tax=Camellia lanceoleosa TaxID=1840588 RepID=A0ACC0FJP9_9ERIC|nr:hypothetical protein LOK49_LG13G00720 [Camellia lanceoleosa]